MDLGLTDKCALVTGGARGIGRAIAASLLAEGARVAFCSRSPEPVRETERQLREVAGAERVFGFPADVATVEGATIFRPRRVAGDFKDRLIHRRTEVLACVGW
jgi:NAD(P)-dependent dehydrogenase (short-subunit alcohol dehydrogenase family)